MNIQTTTSLYPISMLVLSHSSRESFRSCSRKLEFRQFYGTPTEQEENYSGEVGKALHEALGTWLKTQDEDATFLKYLMKFPYDLEFLKSQNDKRSLEAGFACLSSIIHSHLLTPYEIAKIKCSDGSIRDALEVPFAIQITGTPLPIPVWFVGYMDIILYNRISGRYVVVDLKTTRMKMDDASPRFQWDEQVVPYGIVLEHALGKQIEELDVSYLNAFIDLMEPKPALYEVKKTQEDIQDWLFGLCDDIERINKYMRNYRFPRATSGTTCISWNRPCQFYDMCFYRDPKVLNRIIDAEPRKTLFSTGEEPWIKATLEFIHATNRS